MRRILLARHGQTSWNAAGKLQGHTDIDLDETGRGQARALAEVVRGDGITRVIASDLSRARETAQIVTTVLGLAPPVIDSAFRERRFGVFEGLTRDQCAEHYPSAWKDWVAQTSHPPGAEPREDATARMQRALDRIVGDDTALVVSHGGVMRLWLMQLLGKSVPLIGNADILELDHEGGMFRAKLRAPCPP